MIEDINKFQKFISILPEKTVDDFANYWLFNARYPKELSYEILDKYRDHSLEILSIFSNDQIEKARNLLNKNFYELREFLILHFYCKNHMPDNPFYYLEPNLESTLKDGNGEWHKIKRQLDVMAKKFKDNYDSFIKISVQELNKKELPTFPTKNKTTIKIQKELTFNAQTGVVRYGEVTHAFQRGTRGEKTRLEFFRLLWSQRCNIKNGIKTKKGEPFNHESLASKLSLISESANFDREPLARRAKKLINILVKGLNKIFRDKKIPVKIEQVGGVQLIVLEK